MIGPSVLLLAAVVASSTGACALKLLGVRLSTDPIVRLGVYLATGLSVIPIVVLWTPLMRWTEAPARIFALLMITSAAWPLGRRAVRARWRRYPWQATVLAATLVITSFGFAMAQVRGVVVAPGVDSPHHLMMTRLILLNGGVPHDLSPFIPGGHLAYHWGAHANVAFLALILGVRDPFAVSRLMVWYSAFLYGVCVLTIYAATRCLFSDRTAAVISAAIAAFVSALPAALVAQGRFTQLAGVAVLPALLVFSRRGIGGWRRHVAIGLLLAGVFLLQARLVIFGLVWLVVSALFFERRVRPAAIRVLIAVTILAVATLPWTFRLLHEPLVRSLAAGTAFAQSKNRWTQRFVPERMVWLPNNGLILSLATGGLSGIVGLGVSRGGGALSIAWLLVVTMTVIRAGGRDAAAADSGRRRRRPASNRRPAGPASARRPPWLPMAAAGCWIVGGAAALFVHSFGVDLTNVVPYAAGLLTWFVPIVIAAGGLAGWVVRRLLPRGRAVAAAAIFVVAGGAGCANVNGQVVRSPVSAADVAAMHWIVNNVPSSSRFAVMAQPFYGIFVGDDAGYWIPVLTDRASILPPFLYGWVLPPGEVEKTNALLRSWTSTPPEKSVPMLMRQGVTHAYIGATAPRQAHEIMRNCRCFDLIHDQDGVLIAKLAGDDPR